MRGGLLITAIVIGVVMTLAKSEEKPPKNTTLPQRDVLLERFEKLNIVKKTKWEEGGIVDGKPILTARFGGDVYTINSKSVSAVSFSDGESAMVGAQHSLAVCADIVSVATGKDVKTVEKKVTNILAEASKEKSLSAADLISGYWFSTDIRTYGNVNAVFCEVKGFTRWD